MNKKVAFLFYVVAAFILVLAVVQRMQMPAYPFAKADSYGYLLPSLSLLQGDGVVHRAARHFMYPLFISLTTAFLGSLKAVVVVQQVLGLLALCLNVASWRQMGKLLGLTRLGQGLYALFGLVYFALVALSQYNAYHGHYLGPEAVFPFFISLLFFVLVKLVCRVCQSGGLLRTGWLSFFFFFFVFATFALMPKFMLSVPLLIGLLALFFLFKKVKLRLLFLPFITAFVLFLVAIVWPEKSLVSRTDPGAVKNGPATIFFFHSHLILPLMEKDFADPAFDRFDKNLLALQIQYAKEEYAFSKTPGELDRELYTYEPDRLLYGKAEKAISATYKGDLDGYGDFCWYYIKRMIQERPLEYAKKVWGQLGLFYRPSAQVQPRQLKAKWFSAEYRYFQTWMGIGGFGGDTGEPAFDAYNVYVKKYSRAYRGEYVSIFHPFEFRRLNGLIDPLNHILVWVTGLFVLLFFPMLFRPAKYGEGLFSYGVLVSALLFVSFGINMTLALTHLLEFERYLLFQNTFTLLFEMGALCFVLLLAGRRWLLISESTT